MLPELKVDKEILKELYSVNSRRNIVHGLAVLLLYVILSYLGFFIDNVIAWFCIWFYQGFILSGFLGASHDCAHETFAKSKFGNRMWGVFWSSTVLFNFSLYKHYHLVHHKHTHVPGDTEPYGSFRNIWDYVRTLPMTGFFFPFWKMSVLAPFNWFPTFIKSRSQQKQVKEDNYGLAIWILLVAIAAILFPFETMKCYFLPILFYFPMVFYTSIPEHYDCNEGTNILTNTRTLESNRLFKFIFWNGNYHAEHHLYPGVPSQNLPKLHRILGHHFIVRENGYIRYHIKMVKGILNKKRDSSNLVFTPEERIVYKYYKGKDL
jgi:fatty acid desaturase